MATVINTNLASLYAQNSLSNAQNNLANSVQRLSSGLRINSAKDDAAGLAISQSMQNQINGVNQSRRNLNDATNLIQVADTSMGTIQDMLLRMKTLTTQGYDGSLSASQRTQIVDEINELNTEINATAARTKFNRNNLISSTNDRSAGTASIGAATGTLASITALNVNTNLAGTFTLTGTTGTVTLSGVISSTYAGVVTTNTYSQAASVNTYSASAGGVQSVNFDQLGISIDITATGSAATTATIAAGLNGLVLTTSATAPNDLYFQGGADTSNPNMVVYDAINIRTDSTSGGFQAMNNLGGQTNLLNSYTTATAQTTWATAFSTMGSYVDAALDLVSEQRSNMAHCKTALATLTRT